VLVLADIVRVVGLIFVLLLIARLVLDYILMFARDYTPRGFVLVLAEIVFTITDPPLKFVRRFVPPLRIGGISLDLAFLVLLIFVQIVVVGYLPDLLASFA
jgi:YggT family protein